MTDEANDGVIGDVSDGVTDRVTDEAGDGVSDEAGGDAGDGATSDEVGGGRDTAGAGATDEGPGVIGDAALWAQRIHLFTGVPATTGNAVTVLRNGDEIFPAMLSAIDGATMTVDLVTFVYWEGDIADQFADRLAAAARRGCRVRVLLDAIGARKMHTELVDDMRAAGCEVRWFRPFNRFSLDVVRGANHRTHRKVLVCDGQVAFTGGVGIAEEWTGDAGGPDEWRDTHMRVTGPAVAGLAAAFLDNWIDDRSADFDPADEPSPPGEATGDVTCGVVLSSAEHGPNDAWRLRLGLIGRAVERIRLTTAYFQPDAALREALANAVRRGVDVKVLVPGEHHDKRLVQLAGESEFELLADAGVELFTYERSMLHAKVLTVDGAVAAVGSTNFNMRSIAHDEEVDLVIVDTGIVAELDAHFDDDLTAAVPLEAGKFSDPSPLRSIARRATELARRWF